MTASVLEDLDWSADALAAIGAAAATGHSFDAYDLTERGLRQPPHPNMWGSAFRAAAQAGTIHAIGFHQSGRASRSGGVCRIWVGTTAAERSAA